MNFQCSSRFLMSQGEVISLNCPAGYTLKTIIGQLQITREDQLDNLVLRAGEVSSVGIPCALTIKAMSHAFVSVTESTYSRQMQECKA